MWVKKRFLFFLLFFLGGSSPAFGASPCKKALITPPFLVDRTDELARLSKQKFIALTSWFLITKDGRRINFTQLSDQKIFSFDLPKVELESRLIVQEFQGLPWIYLVPHDRGFVSLLRLENA